MHSWPLYVADGAAARKSTGTRVRATTRCQQ